MTASTTNLHASCVAVGGRGLLILGPSGSGKSALALQLIALGASLVADDRCLLWRDGAVLRARAPDTLAGLIEARGLGILRADHLADVAVQLVVDLAETETQRLPPQRQITLLDVTCDLVLGSQAAHFPAAVMCYLKAGRQA